MIETIGFYAMLVVGVCILLAIVYYLVKYLFPGFSPPPIVQQIFWIIVVGVMIILAIAVVLYLIHWASGGRI